MRTLRELRTTFYLVVVCGWFDRHHQLKRHELQYLRTTDEHGEIITSNELKQCAFCERTLVTRSDSHSEKTVYGAAEFDAANDVFQRAQLLGFEGGQS